MPRSKGRRPEFGTIDRLPSGSYRARFRINGLLKSLGSYPTWEDAAKALAEHKAKLTLNMVKAPTAKSEQSLDALVDNYFKTAGHKLAPRTQAENRRLLDTLVLPHFAGIPLNQITRLKVDLWWGQSDLRKKPVTRRNAYFALRSVMKYGVRWGYLSESPCQVEDAGATVAKERPVMNPGQFDKIIYAAPAEARAVYNFMLGSHARLGEVVALTLGDIALDAGTVTIDKQITKDGEAPSPTKSKHGRTVKVFPSSFAPVAKAVKLRAGSPATAPLFRRADGSPVTRAYLQYHWSKAAKSVGLEKFHLHDIRHVGLMLAESTGMGIRNVQLRGGHSTTAAALRYQHARLEADAGMADAADAALRVARGEAVLTSKPSKNPKKKGSKKSRKDQH